MKNKIGLLFVALGIFLIVIQPFQTITGAVIDLTSTAAKANFAISIILISIGAFLISKH